MADRQDSWPKRPTRSTRRLWRKCAEQGWTGIIFPEQYGGVGLGLVEMAGGVGGNGPSARPRSVRQHGAAGRHDPRPGRHRAQKKRYLSAICQGESTARFAMLERSASWDPDAVCVEATRRPDGTFR
jgi:alkylation response protein AidB-like acyl-CoA dehydrogenase